MMQNLVLDTSVIVTFKEEYTRDRGFTEYHHAQICRLSESKSFAS